MKQNVTIRDVALEAGVSVATVSRAIHKNGYISQENQEKILAAIKKLGYIEKSRVRTDHAARQDAKAVPCRRSKVIAVIGGISKEHTFLPRLEHALSIAANNAGFYTLYIAQKPGNENLADVVAKALQENVCGIIISDFADEKISQANKEMILGLPVPVVVVERAVCTELNSVQIDSKQGIYLACKHLYESGRSNLVYVTAPLVGTVGTPTGISGCSCRIPQDSFCAYMPFFIKRRLLQRADHDIQQRRHSGCDRCMVGSLCHHRKTIFV